MYVYHIYQYILIYDLFIYIKIYKNLSQVQPIIPTFTKKQTTLIHTKKQKT